MVRWRIIIKFQPGNMRKGTTALKKIVNHLQKNMGWPDIRIYRGFIGVQENRCEVECDFPSLAAFENAWQKWGKSSESKVLAENYHQLVESEKIEILQKID